MPSKTQINDERLVECFVASFAKLDDLTAMGLTDPVALDLVIGSSDQCGHKQWRPKKVSTNPTELEPIYSTLPAPFPPLFERLLLAFRWAEVDLLDFRLLANPPGPGLGLFLQQISKDRALWKCLREAGYIQFGKGPGGNYDPVCFDIKSRKGNRDYRVVMIDHEEILCYDRVKVMAELAPTFRKLMQSTIEKADHGAK
jgi:hypothetical protein